MEKNITIKINEFELNKIAEKSFVYIIGKRGSGKSQMVKTIINHLNDIERKIIISPTERMNKFYSNNFPDAKIHYSYSNEIITSLLDEQALDSSKRVILVLDDCFCNINLNQNKIRELFMTNCSHNITMILTSCIPLDIRPELRNCVSHVIMFNSSSMSERKKLHYYHASIFPTFNLFNQVFGVVTKDYNAMLINNYGNEFVNSVFWCNSRKNGENIENKENKENIIEYTINTNNININNINDGWLNRIKNYFCCNWLF